MPDTSTSRYERIRLIAAALVVGMISLVQPGCNCSSSNSSSPPFAITSVFPESGNATALVATEVIALFRDDMDGASVESAFSLTLNSSPVTATVSYDPATKLAVLTPATDLLPGTEYRATITSDVVDVNGVAPLTSDFVWSFTTGPAVLLVSKNANNVTSNDLTINADIDATGRYLVFESEASNMVSIATTLNRRHIYRKDTSTDEVVLVSINREGLVEANNDVSNPAMSTNGRYVVFESTADNLDGNSNGNTQIYLKDLDTGAVTLVSRNTNGLPDNGVGGASNAKVSDDGRYVLFQSNDFEMSAVNGFGIAQIYLRDMSSGVNEMISRNDAGFAGTAASSNPDMSADGVHIVFESLATNFTSSNSFKHIYYVNSSVAHEVIQISLTSGGAEANANSSKASISSDGSRIVFHTAATNLDGLAGGGLDDVYLHDQSSSLTTLVSVNPSNTSSGNAASSNAHISGDGDYVVFESLSSDLASGSSVGVRDILVRNLAVSPAIVIEKVDIPASTIDSNRPVISTDGRYVGFHSTEKYAGDSDTLNDVFRAHNGSRQ